jgi:hypothetical protein
MSILATLKCKAGRHTGEWSLPDGKCACTRRCDSCGKLEKETHHVWGPFDYREADRCEQTRRCARCGATHSRSSHEWGSWHYLNTEFTSPQVHTCRRCRLTERTNYTMR